MSLTHCDKCGESWFGHLTVCQPKPHSELPSSTGSLEPLVIRLQSIARKNDDQFRYKIQIEPTRKGIQYSFVCEETADGHAFLTGLGATIEAAVADAANDVESACQEWGYEVV